MKIFVTIKLRSAGERVEKIDGTHFIVAVREPATEGKANRALVKILSQYFHASPSCVTITRGTKSRKKIVEII